MTERNKADQALINALVKQRDAASNSAAEHAAIAEVAMEENARLNSRLKELEQEKAHGNQVADGAGAGHHGGEQDHADDTRL